MNRKLLPAVFFVLFFSVYFLTGAAKAETLRLTLEEAIGLGIKNSSVVQSKALGTVSSRAALAASKASRYPSISASAGWTHLFDQPKTPEITFDSINIPGSYAAAKDPLSISLDASEVIYGFGRIKNSIRVSEENVALSEMDLKEETRKLAVAIEKAFYGYIFAKEVLSVQEEALKFKEETLAVVRKKYDAGISSDYEVMRAESEVESFRPELISAQNQVKFALLAVKDLLGIKEEGEFDVELIGAIEPDYRIFDKQELMRKALQSKYEVQSFKKGMEISEIGNLITKSGNKPTFSGFGSYTLMSGYDSTTGKNRYWGSDSWDGDLTIGASVQVPLSELFPWSKQRADVKKGEVDYERMKLELSSIESGIRLNIENLLLKLEEEKSKISSRQKSVELMLKLYSSTRERYNLGLVSSIELKDVEVGLNSAKLGYLEAMYNYKIAYISLLDAAGIERL